jgi:hypothetical protein
MLEVEQDVSPDSSSESEGFAPDVQKRIDALREVIDGLPPKQKAIALADLAAGGSADTGWLADELRTTSNSIYVLRNKSRKAIRKAMVELGHYPEKQGDES